jgi:stearoyl-CoA desaturase (delta-9 desaturase)
MQSTSSEAMPSAFRRALASIISWFDTSVLPADKAEGDIDRIEWLRVLPFVALHLSCLFVLLVGWSWTAVWVALASYVLRMFAVTGFYHRYFSHKSFKTSRPVQFLFALWAATSVQRGPLWWASHHRNHHKCSDQPEDQHSPVQHGFWHAHIGWMLTRRGFQTDLAVVKDLARYPELRFIDRYDIFVPVLYAVALFSLGEALEAWAPGLGTNGWQLLIWGFFISTVVLFHATVTINSLAHVWGRRRYATKDQSRNNLWLALITFGEGWHNNHHHFPASARQGFYWWEIDLTWYVLKLMSWCRLIWDLKPVPARLRQAHENVHG